MSWTRAQQIRFLSATNAAGCNSEQRYMIMRYAGCREIPPRPGANHEQARPSVTSNFNNSRQFRHCMAIIEAMCKSQQVPIEPPRNHKTWHDLAHSSISREQELARDIVAEAARRLPAKFDSGLMGYAIDHVTKKITHPIFPDIKPETIEQCDGPTTHRVVELLRALVGREFQARGIRPSCFTIPTRAVLRGDNQARKQRNTA